MTDVRLAEKTIELNFCAQMAPLVSPPAWWFGLTQKQENVAGWDVASKVAGVWIRFQLKASNRVLANGTRRFTGHHHQLLDLQARATTPGRVFYVFPTIGSTQELVAANFLLLSKLRLLDVHGVPNIAYPTTPSGALRKNQTHYFDMAPNLSSMTIHSDPVVVSLLAAEALTGALRARSPGQTERSDPIELADDIRGFLRRGRNRVALFVPS